MSYSDNGFDSVSSEDAENLSTIRSRNEGSTFDVFVKKAPKSCENSTFRSEVSTHSLETHSKPYDQVALKQIENSENIIEKLLKEYRDNFHLNKINITFIEDQLLEEYIALTASNFIAYGESHLNHARSYVNLALFYLEFKSHAKQAQKHCQNAMNIMFLVQNKDYSREAIEDYEMIFNYTCGRCCTLLKNNTDGEKNLEKAEEHYRNLTELQSSDTKETHLREWNKKIKIGLAKQYAINQKYSTALVYYKEAIKLLKDDQESFRDLLGLYKDKAKIHLLQKDYDMALEALDLALNLTTDSVEMLDCKIEKAKVHASMSELTGFSNAEILLKQCVDADFEPKDEIIIKKLEANEELVVCFIRQEQFEDAKRQAENLVVRQIDFFGDFCTQVNSTYKLLSSINLKLNDMPSAAIYLKKCIELEELIYGPKHKIVNQTKELFENLKKNPQVAKRLNVVSKADKPKFVAAKKKDVRKEDLDIYKPSNDTLDFSKKIMPIK